MSRGGRGRNRIIAAIKHRRQPYSISAVFSRPFSQGGRGAGLIRRAAAGVLRKKTLQQCIRAN